MTTDDYTLKDSDPRPTLTPYKQDYKYAPDFIDNAIAGLKRSAAMILGDDDAVRDAFYYSRELAKDLKDNDRTEDTLRHILLGGLVESDIGQWYINFREDDVGVEEQIDLNNNEYGRILRNKYPDPNDFLNAAFGAAMAIGQGKQPEIIEGFKPMLSLGTAKPDTESPKLKPFIDEEGTKIIPSAPEPNIPMPKATDDYTQDMNKGGTVMDKQMKMAFMDEGGLKDDGMERDPVSGNEVPSGSLAEEVRDDIPAQLSEGEYVVPADVVRFFGVKFFEDLRMQAKMGLQQMEKSGRIGGEPIEDDSEMMDLDDEALIIAMTPNMNRGGMVRMAEGGISDKDKEAIGVDRTPKPYRDTLMDFSFVGSSLFPYKKLTEETWYHPDGRSMVIKRDANGNVVPTSDAKFTQEPWSQGEPKDTDEQDDVTTQESVKETPKDAASPTTKAEDRAEKVARWDAINKARADQNLEPIVFPGMNQDWYKNRQQSSIDLATKLGGEVLTDSYGQVVYLPEDNYKAIKTSYDRFDKGALEAAGINSMNEYHKLPPMAKIKLAQFELKDELTEKDINDMNKLLKPYKNEDGSIKGFSLLNPIAQKGVEFLGDKLRGPDYLSGGDYVSPKQREYVEYLIKNKGKLNAVQQADLEKFESKFGIDGVNFVDPNDKTRFSSGFTAPGVTINADSGGSGGDNLEETITPTSVPPKAGADLSGGSTKAAETTMKISKQGKKTKEEKQNIDNQIKAAQKKYKKEQQKDKDEKNVDQKIAGQITGKGYVGGSGFTKGGLASKPKPKSKKKRTTKGLGTKPKAT